jgi:Carboxypeptidase regulatory-like domain
MWTPLSLLRSDAGDRAGTRVAWRSRSGTRPRRWLLVVLVGSLAVLALAPAAAQAASASITGTVTSKTGAKLKGIEVTATNEFDVASRATTNSAGVYTISGLSEGEYTVTFYDPTEKYVTLQEESVALEEGKAKTLNATLVETGAIAGTVRSAATGAGVAGARVETYNEEEGYFYSYKETFTGAGGEYEISGLAPGHYVVYFEDDAGGYLSQSINASVGEGAITELNPALKEGGKISGTVTDSVNHSGLSKIGVDAYAPSVGYGSASTNEKGEYTITGLASGSYKIYYYWEPSEAEGKEFEKAPRYIPKYISQYYNGQPSEATAETVSATEGGLTSGIDVTMVPSAPVNTALPTISGTPTVGSPLSCSSGSWTGESLTLSAGWPLVTPFSYQWMLDGAAITGATSDIYVLQGADLGHGLVCEVTASIEAGKASAKSNSFAVAQPIPVVTISGRKLAVSKRVTKVKITCANAPCVGTAKAVLRIVIHRRKGHKKITKKETVVLAAGSYSLAAGKTGTVRLHLTGAGGKKLAHASHHRISSRLVVSVKGGKPAQKTVQLAAK